MKKCKQKVGTMLQFIRFSVLTIISVTPFLGNAQCDETTSCSNNCPTKAELSGGGVFCGDCEIDIGENIVITGDVCWVSGTLEIDKGSSGNGDVIIQDGAAFTVVSGHVDVDDGSLDVMDGSSLIISENASFAVDDEFDVNSGGTVTIYGLVDVDEDIRVNGGTLTVGDDGELNGGDDLLVFGGGSFIIDDGGEASFDDEVTNENLSADPSEAHIVVNGTLNSTDVLLNNTDPNSELIGHGVINTTGTFEDNEDPQGTFGHCDGGSGACISATLPVKLISFTAKLFENQKVGRLEWSTATEIDNFGFYIEKSHDGDVYQNIGFIEGNGSTTDVQHYSFLDYDLVASCYYRLRQEDYDGQFEYSPITFLSLVNADAETPISVYPNPTQGSIEIGGLVLEVYDVDVIDLTGKIIQSFEAVNLNEAEQKINHVLNTLPKGLIAITFTNPGFSETIRLFRE